ncbi:AfsR/SARP family transcriptional regulator [Oceanithermus sp.]
MVVQGEVVAVESIFFSRVPKPQTRAMAPLLWLQRMAWQLLGPRAAAPEDAADVPRLEVRALGALSVRLQGEALPPQRFQTLPWRLFKLFLAHPERVQTPEEIAEALWPDLDPAYAARRVARVVHELRKQIEPDASAPRMLRSVEGGYLFRFTEGYAYDVERFEALIREADAQNDEGQALAGYLAALDLFRGEFLADEPYADWAEAERAYLRALAVRAGERAGELLEAMGQEKASLSLYHRLIAIDPSDPYLYDRLAAVLRSMGLEVRAREIELRKQALLAGE